MLLLKTGARQHLFQSRLFGWRQSAALQNGNQYAQVVPSFSAAAFSYNVFVVLVDIVAIVRGISSVQITVGTVPCHAFARFLHEHWHDRTLPPFHAATQGAPSTARATTGSTVEAISSTIISWSRSVVNAATAAAAAPETSRKSWKSFHWSCQYRGCSCTSIAGDAEHVTCGQY